MRSPFIFPTLIIIIIIIIIINQVYKVNINSTNTTMMRRLSNNILKSSINSIKGSSINSINSSIRRHYSDSDLIEWTIYAKTFCKNDNMDCQCLQRTINENRLSRDTLLDLQLPWHSLWLIHAKDAVDVTEKDTDLWLNVFDKSFKQPEILIDSDGPYGNCGKSCCSAVEQNW